MLSHTQTSFMQSAVWLLLFLKKRDCNIIHPAPCMWLYFPWYIWLREKDVYKRRKNCEGKMELTTFIVVVIVSQDRNHFQFDSLETFKKKHLGRVIFSYRCILFFTNKPLASYLPLFSTFPRHLFVTFCLFHLSFSASRAVLQSICGRMRRDAALYTLISSLSPWLIDPPFL